MTTTVEYLSYDLIVDIAKGTAFLRSRLGDGPLRAATPEEMERAVKVAGNAKARQESLTTDVAQRTGKALAPRRKSAPRLSEVK